MNTKKSRVAALLAGLSLLAVCNLGAEAKIILNDIKGKVEVKQFNAANWTPAQDGMVITTLTTVSTGFDSSVTITMDKNTLFVKPLTRMTVDKLVEDQGTVSTNCYLRVGTVKASIKSAEGVKQDFKVQSPYSTASVRGTVFEDNCLTLTTLEGLVEFVPGRPTRDMQLPPGSEGAALPDVADDFIGSPDVQFDSSKMVLVPAGGRGDLKIAFDGTGGMSKSGDKETLKTDSTVTLSDTPKTDIKPAGDTRDKGVNYGSVTVTVTLPSEAK